MLYVVFAFLAGLLTKFADDYSERKSKKGTYSLILGISYAIAIVVSSHLNIEVLSLIAGVVVGTVISGKIDRVEHIVAILIILGYIVLNINRIVFPIVVAFAISSFIDEGFHEMSNGMRGVWGLLARERIVTPLIALLLSVYSVSYFLYIVAFDIGYKLANISFNRNRNIL
ncbi:MAG: hypothetical protein ACP5H8_01690 [Candidatus Micrarchaeia archaeon]